MLSSSTMMPSEHEARTVFEFPVERLSLGDSDEVIGDMILKVAARCRGLVNEPPTLHKDYLKSLKFTANPKLNRSDRYLNLNTRQVTIFRNHDSDIFRFTPTRTRRDGFKLYTGEQLSAEKSDVVGLAKQLRNAIELCTLS